MILYQQHVSIIGGDGGFGHDDVLHCLRLCPDILDLGLLYQPVLS